MYGHAHPCHKGHDMQYVGGNLLPRNRDDHKMWKLAEEKLGLDRPRRTRRRPRRRNVIADWERELLKASK